MIIEICNFGRQTFDKGRRREDSKYRNLRRAIQRTRNIKNMETSAIIQKIPEKKKGKALSNYHAQKTRHAYFAL